MAYATYLRLYEPASAFRELDRSRWAAYADFPVRPRRRDSLDRTRSADGDQPRVTPARLHILDSGAN